MRCGGTWSVADAFRCGCLAALRNCCLVGACVRKPSLCCRTPRRSRSVSSSSNSGSPANSGRCCAADSGSGWGQAGRRGVRSQVFRSLKKPLRRRTAALRKRRSSLLARALRTMAIWLSNITSQLSAEPQRRAVLAVSTSCVCLRVCLRTTPAASQQSCLFDTLSHSLLFPYLSYLSLKFPYSNALMDRGRNRVL